jgi:hypothetical protein
MEKPVLQNENNNIPYIAVMHDKLVALVDSMLGLYKKYHEARMERDKELYERQIKIVDAQIDKLVYELYGLTEEGGGEGGGRAFKTVVPNTLLPNSENGCSSETMKFRTHITSVNILVRLL